MGGGGVPNTAIPYEKLANTEIPCRKWTKYRYRILLAGMHARGGTPLFRLDGYVPLNKVWFSRF